MRTPGETPVPPVSPQDGESLAIMDGMSASHAPRHARFGALWSMVRENPLLLAIAGIGFSVSFQTVARLAALQHMPGWPVLYPVLIDVAILGFIVEARKAIDDHRSDLVPRLLAWLFSGFTVYVNAHGSPPRDWLGITLHVAAPVTWVAFLELTRWRTLRKKRAERRDVIPVARWLAAPVRTLGMRKRMILHNVTSYAEASAREEARWLGMDLAAAVFGSRWRKVAPPLLVHHLREGTLPAAVARGCSFTSAELPDLVESWVTGAHASRARATAKARAVASSPALSPPLAVTPGKRAAATRGRRPAGARAETIDSELRALAEYQKNRAMYDTGEMNGSHMAAELGLSKSRGRALLLKVKRLALAPDTGPIPVVREPAS